MLSGPTEISSSDTYRGRTDCPSTREWTLDRSCKPRRTRCACIESPGAYEIEVVDYDTCKCVVQEFVSKFAGVDVLFKSAGVFMLGLFELEPIAQQTRQIRINLEGVCNMTHAALKHMNAGARVVTMASSTAVCGVPNQAVYAASKAGVYSLTEALNMELSLRNISVADVSVMVEDTPMIAKLPNKNSPILQHPEFFLDKTCVANTVWQAVHKARLHRVRSCARARSRAHSPGCFVARNTSTSGST
jgi:short-subunit dehydrogenase